MRFQDRVAIVTGGSSGIGLATACRLGSEGARVVVAELRAEAAQRAADEVRAAGAPETLALTCDVAVETNVQATVETTLERFGRLDVIVNNAGLTVFKPLEQHSHDDWTKLLTVDLQGAFWFTKWAFIKMPTGGTIVNVSRHAVETTPLVSSYASAKAALVSLTRSAALEGKDRGIRVNAVLPGAIDTPMHSLDLESGLETISHSDVGKPEDVAAVIAFLASDDSGFVWGTAVRVDGGRHSRL